MVSRHLDGGESLFEKLSNQYVDQTPIQAVPLKMRRAKSIADHLYRMFNTRRGTVPHLADYGLPDISEIYRNLPGSLANLENDIVELTRKYEPRLKSLRVKAAESDDKDFRLAFELSAVIVGGEKVYFKTEFASNGKTKVRPKVSRS